LNSNQASDGSVGLHELDKPEMIERINAFIAAFLSNVPQAGTLDPRGLLVQLRVELNKIGLDFKYDGKHYPQEHMEFSLTQFGGRKGIDNNAKKLEDDGIEHRLGHKLKLVMDMNHPPEMGFHKIEAKVVSGEGSGEQLHVVRLVHASFRAARNLRRCQRCGLLYSGKKFAKEMQKD
jgi:hypothetical protein